ncbi:MAG: hypothetical protein HPY83_10260 [Anaerolineae bacterium]|nr:hypothetical protein [Anaerolineae bacterium]
MNDPSSRYVRSPDGHHIARLRYAQEIRFGPACYNLSLDSYDFGRRIFGEPCLWSPDSSLVAVQEWLTADERRGPLTRLLLVDLESGLECAVSDASKGFLVPLRFEEGKLVYVRRYYTFGPPLTVEYERDLPGPCCWRGIGVA